MRHPEAVPAAAPVRVLMYTAYLPPEYSGAALQALTLARELRRRGHHVEFVTNRWPGLDEHAVVDGFEVQRLEPGRLRKHREFRLWLNLARYVWQRRRDFDLLHSHGAYYTHAFVGPLARALGMRSLVKASLARDDLLGIDTGLAGRLHGLMLRRVDACVGISRELVGEFRDAGIAPDRIDHIPNGVDLTRFQPLAPERVAPLRERLGLPTDRPIALFVGVLDPRKNIRWLAEQWVAHDAFGTGALLVAVGPQGRDDPAGCLRRKLAALAQAHPRHFVLHDFHADVTPYYQCADALLLPSYKEGLPNVVLEAMAAGVPCLAANACGSKELIVEGETGCLYTPDDVQGLAEAVRTVLSAEGRRMGERARRIAEKRFAIPAIAERYEALYARLLGRREPGEMPLLMLTELYLPTKGGTAVMFEDDCRRLGGRSIHVVTAAVPGDADFDIGHPNRIHRLKLRRYDWLRPESLAMYLRMAGRSLQLATSHRFAAVLAGRALPEGLVAWCIGRLRGSKVLIFAHGEELTGWGRGRKFQAMCFALRHADHVIANSDFTRDTLDSLIGVPPRKIVMAYPVVDAERFHPGLAHDDLRARIGLGPRHKLMLSVGRLQRRKGFDQVVRALPGLVARGIDVHHAIVGKGEDWDYLEQLAASLGVGERLHLLGHVEPDDLPRWYNACDLFAMPNRDIEGDTEGFGIVYLEANACAKPAVAGQTGGTGSAVEHGVNGLRVDGTRLESVEDGLARLLQDGALAQRLGRVGRERVIERFTPERRIALLREIVAS
jgi:phosphatidylinositol alpha-1,6-mannosyltransferase